MGDQAEKRFEEKSPWPFYRYGLNRPDFKPNKLRSLHEWHKQMPVLLFVYDATQNRDTYLTLKTLTGLCEISQTKKFPEGNEYYAIDVDLAWTYGKEGTSINLNHP